MQSKLQRKSDSFEVGDVVQPLQRYTKPVSGEGSIIGTPRLTIQKTTWLQLDGVDTHVVSFGDQALGVYRACRFKRLNDST